MVGQTIVGTDGPNLLAGGSGNDTISGLGGDDTIIGAAGDDILYGYKYGAPDPVQVSRDFFDPGIGNDTVIGGGDDDTISYADAPAGVAIDLRLAVAQMTGGSGTDTLINIGNVIGSAYNDTLHASNELFGTVDGGPGNDVMVGNIYSTVSYASAIGPVSVSLAIAGPQNTIGAGIDTITGFGDLTGSKFDDTLTGSGDNNTIDGGVGADTMIGGDGDDFYYVDNSNDKIVETPTGGVDAVYSTVSYALSANVEDLILQGDGAQTGKGNDTANTIVGGEANSILLGEGGSDSLLGGGDETTSYNDTLDGGTGADYMQGGNGNDLYYVDNVGDVVDETALHYTEGDAFDVPSDGNDTVDSSISYTLPDRVENLNLLGTADLSGTGNPLNNVIVGNSGKNVLSGGDGANTLIGGAGDDILYGYESGYFYSGSQSAGSLGYTGATAHNVFDPGIGNDTVYGEGPGDTVTYADAPAAVIINLRLLGEEGPEFSAPVAQNTGGSGVDTLVNISNVIGSAFNDTLYAAVVFEGSTVDGGPGNDVLVGTGFTLEGESRVSYASATAGVAVSLAITTAQNTIGAGIDTISGFAVLQGSRFDDKLTGAGIRDSIEGGAGNDTLISGAGEDYVDGGDGIDTASYANSDAAVQINLGTGKVSGGYATGDVLDAVENLSGSVFNDTLAGDAGSNALYGGAGFDVLDGGAGADTLDGGSGVDAADYSNSNAAVQINLAAGKATGGDATGDVLINIESLAGSSFDDSLTGDASSNYLSGGNGSDSLQGGAGADVIDGGVGVDTAIYANSNAAVQVNLGAHTAASGDAAGDVLTNIENLTGSVYNDTLTGNAAANSLIGGSGYDILQGGAGADTIDGGSGVDAAVYTVSNAAVQINLGAGTAAGGDAAGDVLINIETLVGSSFNDTLTGSSGANWLIGGSGYDVLQGGAGADTIDGGSGVDAAVYSSSNAAVQVNLAAHTAAGGDATGDVLTNIESLVGSAYNDALTGDANANFLNGGSGNDTLTGGGGVDVFQFSGGNTGSAKITDFVHGIDKIQISGFSSFAALMSATTTDASGNAVIHQASGYAIMLQGVSAATLSSTDFLFG